MNDELNELIGRTSEMNVDIINLINNYKTIENWKETKVKGLIGFIHIVFKTSSLIILEDMLKKGLRFNHLFKTKEKDILQNAVKNMNYKLVKFLNIHNFDFTVVDKKHKTMLDHFALSSSYKKKTNFIESKKILKIILKDPNIFKNSRNRGNNAIIYSFTDPYLLNRMILKKFGDPTPIAVLENILKLTYSYDMCKVLSFKYFIEKSTELKKRRELKEKLQNSLLKIIFFNFKKLIWAKGRGSSYLTKTFILSMMKHSIND